MIPKIIHYCWFGRNPLPDIVIKCIESWKTYCPDYEIREWNEDNFDIQSNTYVSEAYAEKKWAFVSDYVRLVVLEKYGGIYLDTDMELLRSLDIFLTNKAFSGFESPSFISAGIIGCEPNNDWIHEILVAYTDRHFRLEDGSLDLTTIPKLITQITQTISNDIQFNNTFQILDCGLTLYPTDIFYPMDNQTGIVKLADTTYTIHHFAGSWCSPESKALLQLNRDVLERHPFLKRYLVTSCMLNRPLRLMLSVYSHYKLGGIREVFHSVCNFVFRLVGHN